MPGLTWLKGQEQVVALADEEYPSWLWTILEPTKFSEEDMQPGGKGFKTQLKKERRDKIKLSNFMKTQ
jgi:large subunit ribosomal protein L54